MKMIMGSKSRFTIFIPLFLYLAAKIVFYYLGFKGFSIPWGYYQILDREALVNYPGISILLLHSQPPLLNTILVAMLMISQGFNGSVNLVEIGYF